MAATEARQSDTENPRIDTGNPIIMDEKNGESGNPKIMDAIDDDHKFYLQIEADEEPLSLRSDTIQALKEFLLEQQKLQQEEKEEYNNGVDLVDEDWRLSQFWYDEETAETVVSELRHLSLLTSSPVVCISCPTIYVYLKKIQPNINVKLLEYDKRFEQYGSDFTFYDYNQPENLPPELEHAYQIVVADPPYLSKECLEKVAQTISYLKQHEQSYLLLLTGEVQKELAGDLINLYPCGFRPKHSSKLGNEFMLFTSYDPEERLGGWARTKM